MKLLLPQEIETFYVIPSLRKHLALAMKKNGVKQKDIADIFGINTAAISQYISNKRGGNIVFSEEIIQQINTSSKKINNKVTYLQEIQKLLQFIRESKFLCQIHKQFSEIPESCDPQEMGCHGGCR